MKYDIGYKIGFTGTHTIEADSEEEAVEKFKDMISNEEINGDEFYKFMSAKINNSEFEVKRRCLYGNTNSFLGLWSQL